MIYEVFTRIMVGLPVTQAAATEVLSGFHADLGLEPDAPVDAAYAALAEAAPRHKRNEPDRQRYELALEAHVDARWDVDCALVGVSDGGLDPKRCQLWVGVRVEQWEHTTRADMPAQLVRPKVLRKGDLSAGSDLARALGVDVKKQFDHAARMFQRARMQIEGDAITRTKTLPTSRQHEVDWWLLRWIVPVKG